MTPAPFVAIDGEAIDGDYRLLCRYGAGREPAHVLDLDTAGGLRTVTCLEFLLNTPRPRTLVCFGLNYDTNNWLRELPRRQLRELWETQYTYWRDYRLEWLPGRWLKVWHVDGRYAEVCEVFGFFQTSFVRSLADWGLEAPGELQLMKQARGTFTAADRRRIVDYCLAECRLLVELMDRVRAACRDAGTTPRKWIGAGSIATALLARQKMDPHHAYDLDLAPDQVVEDAVLGSYFGGRVEMLAQGVFSKVQTLDLRSAYPAAATELPSLDGAKLVHRRRLADGHGIWRVRWELGGTDSVAPFPVRSHYAIHYPLRGEGWYHGCEVRAAIAAGYPVEVLEGYVLRAPRKDARPFAWLGGLYRKRAELKRRGEPAEKVLKLGMNSIYGKLAQGYGYGARPRWQSYFWAGYITARTRSRVLEILTRVREPIMVATDGVFCRGAPATPRRTGLGSWERGRLDRLFAAQPGVYQGLVDGGELIKSRGFFASEVDYDELREGWSMEGPRFVHRYRSTRFVGLGAALARTDFAVWRQWVEDERSLALWPDRKVLTADGLLRPSPGPLVSEPYQPKVSLLDARAVDYMQGMEQPLREGI